MNEFLSFFETCVDHLWLHFSWNSKIDDARSQREGYIFSIMSNTLLVLGDWTHINHYFSYSWVCALKCKKNNYFIINICFSCRFTDYQSKNSISSNEWLISGKTKSVKRNILIIKNSTPPKKKKKKEYYKEYKREQCISVVYARWLVFLPTTFDIAYEKNVICQRYCFN